MPTSGPASSSEARAFPAAQQAVSEVIGQILVFGILSMVLVLSMVAFGVASESAIDRGARLQAEGITQQVASVVVEASLFVEARPAGTTYVRQLHLPEDLEGSSYTIHLQPALAPDPDRIVVEMHGLEQNVTASVFAAGAPANVELCASSAAGGPIAIRYDDHPSAIADSCLFIEAT